MTTTVANIKPTDDGGLALFCLVCEFARVFDSMEALEFTLQKHFRNAHGFSVSERVGSVDGKVTRIPE
jgi:hypothetical protein